jgi:hypothetical protein
MNEGIDYFFTKKSHPRRYLKVVFYSRLNEKFSTDQNVIKMEDSQIYCLPRYWT